MSADTPLIKRQTSDLDRVQMETGSDAVPSKLLGDC